MATTPIQCTLKRARLCSSSIPYHRIYIYVSWPHLALLDLKPQSSALCCCDSSSDVQVTVSQHVVLGSCHTRCHGLLDPAKDANDSLSRRTMTTSAPSECSISTRPAVTTWHGPRTCLSHAKPAARETSIVPLPTTSCVPCSQPAIQFVGASFPQSCSHQRRSNDVPDGAARHYRYQILQQDIPARLRL